MRWRSRRCIFTPATPYHSLNTKALWRNNPWGELVLNLLFYLGALVYVQRLLHLLHAATLVAAILTFGEGFAIHLIHLLSILAISPCTGRALDRRNDGCSPNSHLRCPPRRLISSTGYVRGLLIFLVCPTLEVPAWNWSFGWLA